MQWQLSHAPKRVQRSCGYLRVLDRMIERNLMTKFWNTMALIRASVPAPAHRIDVDNRLCHLTRRESSAHSYHSTAKVLKFKTSRFVSSCSVSMES